MHNLQNQCKLTEEKLHRKTLKDMVLPSAIYQQLKFELILSEYIAAIRNNKQNSLLLVTVVIFNGG